MIPIELIKEMSKSRSTSAKHLDTGEFEWLHSPAFIVLNRHPFQSLCPARWSLLARNILLAKMNLRHKYWSPLARNILLEMPVP
jgi:hypothetical protein